MKRSQISQEIALCARNQLGIIYSIFKIVFLVNLVDELEEQ